MSFKCVNNNLSFEKMMLPGMCQDKESTRFAQFDKMWGRIIWSKLYVLRKVLYVKSTRFAQFSQEPQMLYTYLTDVNQT